MSSWFSVKSWISKCLKIQGKPAQRFKEKKKYNKLLFETFHRLNQVRMVIAPLILIIYHWEKKRLTLYFSQLPLGNNPFLANSMWQVILESQLCCVWLCLCLCLIAVWWTKIMVCLGPKPINHWELLKAVSEKMLQEKGPSLLKVRRKNWKWEW